MSYDTNELRNFKYNVCIGLIYNLAYNFVWVFLPNTFIVIMNVKTWFIQVALY